MENQSKPLLLKYSLEQLSEMVRMRESGASFGDIAARFGTSNSAAKQISTSFAYSEVGSQQILSLFANGHSAKEIAHQLQVSLSQCHRVLHTAKVPLRCSRFKTGKRNSSYNTPNLEDGCRTCTTCKQRLPLAEFPPQKARPGGRIAKCRDCFNAYKDAYRKRKPEVKERANERTRGTRGEYYRDYRRRNPLKVKAVKHAYMARRKNAPGSWTKEEWEALLEKYGNKCLRCGAAPVVIEHIIALSTFGTNSIDNLQPLCARCNTWKGSRTIDFRPDKSCLLPQARLLPKK